MNGGGFRLASGGYEPPTISWIQQEANSGPITLSDSDGLNINITGRRWYDNSIPSTAYDWNAPQEAPVIRLNFSSYNTNRRIFINSCAYAGRRPFITGNLAGGRVVVTNSNIIALPWPTGVFDRIKGRVINVSNGSIEYHNNYEDGFGGRYLASSESTDVVRLTKNICKNIDGIIPKENGQVWQGLRQFFQGNGLRNPTLLIEDNLITNELNKSFYVEDMISLFNCVATAGNPMIIQRNLFDTGGMSEFVRFVYQPNGARQNGYSGTCGMNEINTAYAIWRNNLVLQYSTGLCNSGGNNILFENNTVASTGYFESGKNAGKIITMSNGAFFATGGSGGVVLRGNRTTSAYHNRLSEADATVNPTMNTDTVVHNSIGQFDSPGARVENHSSYNIFTGQWENPPFFNNQNGGGPNDYNGRGLVSNAFIQSLRQEHYATVAIQAAQGILRGPTI